MTNWVTRFWMFVGPAIPAALLAGCTSEAPEPTPAYGPRPCSLDTECQYNGGFCNQATHHCDVDLDASVDNGPGPDVSHPDTGAQGDSDAPLTEESDVADSGAPADANDEVDGNGPD